MLMVSVVRDLDKMVVSNDRREMARFDASMALIYWMTNAALRGQR
jgi:hypothetical protein